MDTPVATVTSNSERGIGWLVFDNQQRRNAMTLEMWQQAEQVLKDFERNPDVKVVVMRGAGDKAFISGADISQFDAKRNNAEAARQYSAVPDQARRTMSGFEKPLIAMIKGFCFGAGLDVAMRADIRIVAADAVFCIPAARLGIAYAFDSVHLLYELVGPAVAKDLLFSGRKLDADEAMRIGLVNRVCPVGRVEEVVQQYAATLADNAPLSIRSAKANVNELRKDPQDRNLERAAQFVWDCFDSEDYQEGRRAFNEKRPPAFRGH